MNIGCWHQNWNRGVGSTVCNKRTCFLCDTACVWCVVKKKSYSFTREEVFEYLRAAPDTPEHVRAKVALLAGYYGALRCDDLVKLMWSDVEVGGVWCKLISRKTWLVQDGHNFLIQASDSDERVCGIHLFEKYHCSWSSRSLVVSPWTDATENWLILLGKNFVRQIPKFFATFLELPDPSKYTGQSYRRTSATNLHVRCWLQPTKF